MGEKEDKTRLDKAYRDSRFKDFRWQYKSQARKFRPTREGAKNYTQNEMYDPLVGKGDIKDEDKTVYALSRARTLIKKGNIDQAIEGAGKYNDLKRLRHAMPLLLKRIETQQKTGVTITKDQYERVNSLIQDAYRQRESKIAKEEEKRKDGSLVERLSAFIFLIAGFIFMVIPDFATTTTGNVIGSSSGATLSFFLSLGLMIIGGVLLFINLKK